MLFPSDKASQIKLLICDVDGVLTNGHLYFSEQQESLKVFHVHDGLAFKLLQSQGIACAIITSRHSDMVATRMKQLEIKYLYQGQHDKSQAFNDLLQHLAILPQEVAYIGDDLPDLNLIREVGLGVAVQNALPYVKENADWVTQLSGGQGCVRELADAILQAQGKWQQAMELFS